MKKYTTLLYLFAFAVLLNACKKGEPLPEKSFANITVISKALLDVPPLTVYVDSVLLDTVGGGSAGTILIERKKTTMKLTIKNLQTGKTLLDSTFTVKPKNSFTVLVDNSLGIATFYTPSTKPIPADSGSVQLFCNSVVGGMTGKGLTFKLFTTYDNANTFNPTTYEVKNLENGKLAAPLMLPLTKDAVGVMPTYYIQTVDPDTGTILSNLFPGFSGYGQVTVEPGKNNVVKVDIISDPLYGNFYNSPFLYFPL
ncbi:hypothetical protein BDD43_3580 [Mucilaginibacter gracilis]|uniref:DUF4397 domain-containing protein n=1 Tax=Mucilaginibacter gracilis TaxID=423350 RepID=A0A495J3H0_9SPHI|nr:hypothetical protein BDD43_3580 [Mucilaginibacter gracilis]